MTSFRTGYGPVLSYLGDRVYLTCSANGYPDPPCTWPGLWVSLWVLQAASQGDRAELDRVLAQYQAHKQEVHRANTP